MSCRDRPRTLRRLDTRSTPRRRRWRSNFTVILFGSVIFGFARTCNRWRERSRKKIKKTSRTSQAYNLLPLHSGRVTEGIVKSTWLLAVVVGCLAGTPGAFAAEAAKPAVDAVSGPLKKYIANDDASYQWSEWRTGQLGGSRYVELRMVSQTWRGTPWKHQLFILKPSTATSETKHGLLFIGGGRWRPELEDPQYQQRLPNEAYLLAAVAEQLKSPVAIVLQVPHQPILGGRFEDDAIAHTFEQYLRTGESDWPLLLPMVKSAVRAMDATQEYARQNWSMQLETFTVTGASKP